MEKNFSLENSIGKFFLKKKLYLRDKKRINKIIKNIYQNLDSKKDNFHTLSKKFILSCEKSSLKKFTKFNTVIIIGMGGSILGAQTIYSFLKQKIKKIFYFLII